MTLKLLNRQQRQQQLEEKVNEMQSSANDKEFTDKDDELLNSAKWYIEGLDKRLVRHRVRLVIEPNLSFNEHVEAR